MDRHIVKNAQIIKRSIDKEILKLKRLTIKVDLVLDVDMINIMVHSNFTI